jgi:hypothetical protein
MKLKERIENNLIIFYFSALLIGFLSGIGSYKAIIEIAKLETVPKYKIEKLKDENEKLKQKHDNEIRNKNQLISKYESKIVSLESEITQLKIEDKRIKRTSSKNTSKNTSLSTRHADKDSNNIKFVNSIIKIYSPLDGEKFGNTSKIIVRGEVLELAAINDYFVEVIAEWIDKNDSGNEQKFESKSNALISKDKTWKTYITIDYYRYGDISITATLKEKKSGVKISTTSPRTIKINSKR